MGLIGFDAGTKTIEDNCSYDCSRFNEYSMIERKYSTKKIERVIEV
jgi:hypothetical protein